MKRRIRIASVEFLKSEPGRRMARAMVTEYVEAARLPAPPTAAGRSVNDYFEDLLREFIEHLRHDIEPYAPPGEPPYEEADLREALADAYAERFRHLFPKDPFDIADYLLRLTRLVRWLAKLTCEVWLLDTHPAFGEYPPEGKSEDKTVRVYHLQWAREAFGWWRANVMRFRYRLRLPRPCRCEQEPVSDAIAEALDDALYARLQAVADDGKPVEVEDGCPLC